MIRRTTVVLVALALVGGACAAPSRVAEPAVAALFSAHEPTTAVVPDPARRRL